MPERNPCVVFGRSDQKMVGVPQSSYPMAHANIDTFVHDNEQRLLDELLTLLRIPSISTSPEHKPDVERAAQYVADALRKAGLENIEIIPTAGHPLVYGDWTHAEGKPTVLC